MRSLVACFFFTVDMQYKILRKTRGPKIVRRRGDKYVRDGSAFRHVSMLILFSRFSNTECTRDFLPVVGIVRCLDRKDVSFD